MIGLSGREIELLILLCQVAATFYMVGLIWFVQFVHYPLLAGIGPERFPGYHRDHTSRTTWVVGPPMLLEAASTLALLMLAPSTIPHSLPWFGALLLCVVWLSTALLQIPCHRALSQGFNASTHRRLVATNWIRTATWSLRGALVVAMMFWATLEIPA